MLYLVRLEGQLLNANSKFEELVNANIDLRQYTANDVLKLWEDLTHQEQQVDYMVLSKIDYILSNAFYYQMDETSDQYSVKLLIDGFEDVGVLSKIHLILHLGEYRTSYFTDHMEQLLVECKSNNKIRYSSKFIGTNLVGFDLGCSGYLSAASILYASASSTIFPQFPEGLLICLYAMMTHPAHRIQFIEYLKSLESQCSKNCSDC
jgi:hypothetical protein